MTQILSSPSYWSKLAEADGSPASSDSNSTVLIEFVRTLKTAGLSDGHIWGLISGVTESFYPGFAKFADEPPAPAAVSPYKGVKVNEPFKGWSPFEDHPIDGLIRDVSHPLQALARGNPELADWYKTWKGDPNATSRVTVAAANKSHPILTGALNQLYDQKNPASLNNEAEVLQNFNDGEYAKGIGQIWSTVKASPTFNTIKDYAVPALATVAASRLAGADWGTSAALGAGAGYAYGNNTGGVKDFLKGETAPAAAPKATAPAATSPEQKADDKKTTTSAENTMDRNSALAQQAAKIPTKQYVA